MKIFYITIDSNKTMFCYKFIDDNSLDAVKRALNLWNADDTNITKIDISYRQLEAYSISDIENIMENIYPEDKPKIEEYIKNRLKEIF